MAGLNLARKLIGSHLVSGEMTPGHEVGLVNFGVLPLEFADPADYDDVQSGDELVVEDLEAGLRKGELSVRDTTRGTTYAVRHRLSPREVATVRAGGRIAEHKRD
jgi:aconitate hydratase